MAEEISKGSWWKLINQSNSQYKNMKKVLILFGKKRWDDKKPFVDKKYMYSYEYFYDLSKESGVQFYRASYQWYDYEKKIFKYAWSYEESGDGWKKVYDIKPDLIHDKTKSRPEVFYKNHLIAEDYPFFNNLEFTKIIDDKLNTSLLFPKWSKKNWLIEDQCDLAKKTKNIKTEKVVLKPLNLSGGEDVMIMSKEELLEKKNSIDFVNKRYVLQEFIDSSSGIEGVMKGVHDLRLVFVNDKLSYSYYRKPAEGKLLANIAQGGSMEIVPENKLLESTKEIIKEANEKFSGFRSKIYTIDLMFDENGRPWIVELNSMPGMYFAPGQEDTRKTFYGDLLDAIKGELVCSEGNNK